MKEVFVLPSVFVGMPEHETVEREVPQSNSYIQQIDGEKGEVGTIFRERRRTKKSVVLKREDLHIILANHRRLIILGDPGSGKSTLLHYLILLLSDSGTFYETEFPSLAEETQSLSPVYIPLAAYAETLLSNAVGERSILDFISKYLHDRYLGEYNQMILEQLLHGKVFFLLDGLDEIPDLSLRIQVVRDIESFTQSFPDNRFIVTSRLVGYRDAPLAAEYEAFTIADFDKEQIRSFTKKWCPAYEHWVNQVDDSQFLFQAATSEAEKLFQATQQNNGVKRLAVNPLLLTILALIQRQGIELPSHRVELYDLCVSTLLDLWVKAKGYTGPKISDSGIR